MAKSNARKVVASEKLPIPLQEPITVELDTGREVEMVIGELSMLYELGEIPDELSAIAARELFSPRNDDDPDAAKRYAERMRLVRWVVKRVLVSDIPVEHLYHDEIFEIYNLGNNPARALSSFRRQQARHVGAVPTLQDSGG